VCGDETQKPFPLLVWNLQSRKLLYDLRIPHHDFITSLSAITYEGTVVVRHLVAPNKHFVLSGSYVCCVCHEIDEPNPNFIVVYDLQSGTLFKKWKPSCNTVSLEISSQGGCVISGLEDARILVWDLITGNIT
jgi:WD40 repeat protein